MSWVITGSQKNKGLLDEFTGAAAAYSLRNLTILNDAPVVRVRRSSDNAEADFKASEVSGGALTSWVGAGNNGFVSTWYDQTNNGRHVTSTNRPQIVANGSLVIRNGKPALSFTSGNVLQNNALFNSGAYSAFITAEYRTGTYIILPTSAPPTTSVREIINVTNGTGGYQDITLASITAGFDVTQATGDQFNMNVLFDGSNYQAYVNGNQKAITTTGPLGHQNEFFAIGNRPTQANTGYAGNYQELILYFSNQSTNRTAIEANINAHYAIY